MELDTIFGVIWHFHNVEKGKKRKVLAGPSMGEQSTRARYRKQKNIKLDEHLMVPNKKLVDSYW